MPPTFWNQFFFFSEWKRNSFFILLHITILMSFGIIVLKISGVFVIRGIIFLSFILTFSQKTMLPYCLVVEVGMRNYIKCRHNSYSLIHIYQKFLERHLLCKYNNNFNRLFRNKSIFSHTCPKNLGNTSLMILILILKTQPQP